MIVEPCSIEGVRIVTPKRFADARGHFAETYSKRAFGEAGIGDEFVQDNQSLSRAPGTLRGLHFQIPPFAQAKLVRALRGSAYDVAVDLRAGSPSFGRHVACVLSSETGNQIYIPVGFAHGFLTLEPDTEIFYKASQFYSPEHDKGIAWDDPDLAIPWPRAPAATALSAKDRHLPRLREVVAPFAYAAPR